MARKAISEFRAKKLLSDVLGVSYSGSQAIDDITEDASYVVKVDQGVKGRFKKGLVKLNATKEEIPAIVKAFHDKGYQRYIIEPEYAHASEDEKYLAIERVRDGFYLSYSTRGGVDIESHPESVHKVLITSASDTHIQSIAKVLGVGEADIANLLRACDTYYFSFVEINPFVVVDGKMKLLDAAVEVDTTAQFFVQNAWNEDDFAQPLSDRTPEEQQVEALAAKSQAAFNLTVLNKNGSIFMLLSGGGASIVLADEAKNLGYGHEVANYGEYSGNPNAEETYLYTKNVLSLLLKSTADRKVLIIAGGVANFTDIRSTFIGVIRAIDEVKEKLREQGVKIFVRRGGPHQKEGLQRMKDFLQKEDLLGVVAGSEMVLTDIVAKAIEHITV